MPNINESYVQVAPDSSGKQVRNLALQVQENDGSYATVYMQAVVSVDEFGNTRILSDEAVWRNDMLDELRAIRMILQAQSDAGTSAQDQEDFLGLAKAFRDTQDQLEV